MKTQPTKKSARLHQPCSVRATSRQVIENKLLDALTDDGCVAALLHKPDLDVIIDSLIHTANNRVLALEPSVRARQLAADLRQLRAAAFPPNAGTER
jgi:hypothetical protein